jgi:hypothetical protein
MTSGYEQGSPQSPDSIPTGFEKVRYSCGSPSEPVWIEDILPDSAHYAATLKRLARKATQRKPFDHIYYNARLGTCARHRDAQFSMPGSIVTVREVHDATTANKNSLLQIWVIAQLSRSMFINNVVRPTQYSIYSPETDELSKHLFATLPDKPSPSFDLNAVMELEAITGQNGTAMPDRSFFYKAVLYSAGEQPGIL